ncbi:MAG TPA: Sec-independent protein translocase protein TatB [Acetobacteraceae bacterium]|nr:Sec-independent protein translocase protein TatB [Acetobacteraceae bacterium]
MFDFAWSEIALIGVVALIAIGPKDMPGAVKAVSDVVKKARRMAAEFQTHVDDLVREADLHEVRQQINEIRGFDLRGTVERAIDEDGSLRRVLNEDPLRQDFAGTPVAGTDAAVDGAAGDAMVAELVEERPEYAIAPPDAADPSSPLLRAPPAFIPPAIAAELAAEAAAPPPPAFIPPGLATSRRPGATPRA